MRILITARLQQLQAWNINGRLIDMGFEIWYTGRFFHLTIRPPKNITSTQVSPRSVILWGWMKHVDHYVTLKLSTDTNECEVSEKKTVAWIRTLNKTIQWIKKWGFLTHSLTHLDEL